MSTVFFNIFFIARIKTAGYYFLVAILMQIGRLETTKKYI
jgi:hypothetical protein